MADDAFRRLALQSIKSRDGWGKNLSVAANWSEPDRSLLESADPEAPRFPIEVLGRAGNYVASAARGANAPVDYVAAMLMVAVGAIVGKKCHVRLSNDWIEPVSLWCVIVGPPSSGKTPACKPVRSALRSLEKKWAADLAERLQREIAEAQALDASLEEINSLNAELNAPPRLLINDSTAEALARVEMRAPDGLLVERDELAGLIEGLERYGAGGDRAFYLEGYDSGAFTIDRVKAGTLHIDNHCFSIFGGIQPDRLRTLLTHSGDDDGFAARLLIFWPDPIRPTTIPSGADHTRMETALGRLDDLRHLSEGQPIDLWLTDDAMDMLNGWYGTKFSDRVGTTGKIGSAYGKLAGMTARIAGCLHLLNHAFGDEVEHDPTLNISSATVSNALELIEGYFVRQIERTYSGTGLPGEERIAAALLNHCRENGLQAFNLRQARREWGISGSARKGAVTEFDGAAALLIETGWARQVHSRNRTKDYEINPILFSDNRSNGSMVSLP
ncbi:MAG: DUF3987 domain-containing protein [Pseudomonadota bacterium]